MKNFSTVFNFELKQFFAKKATKVIMAIYFVIAIGITFVPSIANSNLFKGDSNDNFNRSAYVVKDANIKLEDNKQALKTLSKGNAQKIQIIQSVMNDPDILVFDEPFSGLDPVNVSKLKEIITDFIKKDKLVIFSSHQMPVVETFCEDINILEKGEITLSGNLDYIKKQLGHGKMILSVSNLGKEELLANLRSIPLGIEYSLVPEGVLLDFKEEGSKKELLAKLAGSSFNIEEFKLYKPSLEDIFKEQVGK